MCVSDRGVVSCGHEEAGVAYLPAHPESPPGVASRLTLPGRPWHQPQTRQTDGHEDHQGQGQT